MKGELCVRENNTHSVSQIRETRFRNEVWRTVVSLALSFDTLADFVENPGAYEVFPYATTRFCHLVYSDERSGKVLKNENTDIL